MEKEIWVGEYCPLTGQFYLNTLHDIEMRNRESLDKQEMPTYIPVCHSSHYKTAASMLQTFINIYEQEMPRLSKTIKLK